MRRLTLEEADLVNSSARPDGERPFLFRALTRSESEISPEFEAFLILASTGTKNQVASFFRTVLDNDPNSVEIRTQLMTEFLDEEKRNELEMERAYEQLVEYYDQSREALSSSLDGFEDVEEAILLQETLSRSLGDVASCRDRHAFNYAALSTLASRLEAGGFSDFRQELQSWVRVLVEYD